MKLRPYAPQFERHYYIDGYVVYHGNEMSLTKFIRSWRITGYWRHP